MLRWNKVTCMLLWQWLFIPGSYFPHSRVQTFFIGAEVRWTWVLNPVFSGNVHSSFCCAVEWSHQQPAKCVILWRLNTRSEIQQRLRLFSADLCYCSVFYSGARASQCSALPIKCEPDKERERGREGSGGGLYLAVRECHRGSGLLLHIRPLLSLQAGGPRRSRRPALLSADSRIIAHYSWENGFAAADGYPLHAERL